MKHLYMNRPLVFQCKHQTTGTAGCYCKRHSTLSRNGGGAELAETLKLLENMTVKIVLRNKYNKNNLQVKNKVRYKTINCLENPQSFI